MSASARTPNVCVITGLVCTILFGGLDGVVESAQAQCSLVARPDLVRTSIATGQQANSVVNFDDGTGPTVFVARPNPGNLAITRRLASGEFVGTNFAPGITVSTGRVLFIDDDPDLGRVLLAAAGNRVLRWSPVDQRWEAVGGPLSGPVYALTRFADAAGSSLVAGMHAPSGQFVQRFVNGTWQSMGGNASLSTQALAYVDSDGPAGPNPGTLYAAGYGGTASGTTCDVMRWDGSAWRPLPAMGGWTNTIISFDDGSGPALYGSGHGTSGILRQSTNLAKWTGTQWVGIDPRVNNPTTVDGSTYGLGVFNDGTGHGSELYILTIGSLLRLRDGVISRVESFSGYVNFDYQQVGFGVGPIVENGVPVLWSPASGNIRPYASCPRCTADFDLSGNVTQSDVLNYLNAWFSGAPSADVNQSGGTPSLEDLFTFLNAWFSGC